MKDGADIVDLEGAPRPDSEPATPRLSSARIHKTASHLSIRSNARSEASTVDDKVPGLAKSTRRPNGRFFTGTGGENTSASRRFFVCCDPNTGLLGVYNRCFRYVVLWKFLPTRVRKRLHIPLLIGFWCGFIVLIGWVYNISLYAQTLTLNDEDNTCVAQCAGLFGGTCEEELREIKEREKATDAFFLVNSAYITVAALVTIHIVMAITSSLRNVGRALNKVAKKRDFSSISNILLFSAENATAETRDVMDPVRALVQQGLAYKKRAEKAESKWAEAARRAETLEALAGRDSGRSSGSGGGLGGGFYNDASGRKVEVFCATWNLGNRQPPDSLSSWLGAAKLCDVVAVGVQECSYSVSGGMGVLPGQGCARHFREALERELGAGYYLEEHALISGGDGAMEDLAAIRLYVFCRREHRPYIKSAGCSTVRTGTGKVTLNKGAVGVRLWVFGLRCEFVNAHLAHGAEATLERNQDYQRISRRLFNLSKRPRVQDFVPHACFWLGDLNYRVELPREEVVDKIERLRRSGGSFGGLLVHDQLLQEMTMGRTFGLSGCHEPWMEAKIEFLPTYKLNEDRSGYDDKRAPAWCDRILHSALEGAAVKPLSYGSDCVLFTSDHHPVSAVFGLTCPPLPRGRGPPRDRGTPVQVGCVAVDVFSREVGRAVLRALKVEEGLGRAMEGEEDGEGSGRAVAVACGTDVGALLAGHLMLTVGGPATAEEAGSVDWVGGGALEVGVAEISAMEPLVLGLHLRTGAKGAKGAKGSKSASQISFDAGVSSRLPEGAPPPSPRVEGEVWTLLAEAAVRCEEGWFSVPLASSGLEVGKISGEITIG